MSDGSLMRGLQAMLNDTSTKINAAKEVLQVVIDSKTRQIETATGARKDLTTAERDLIQEALSLLEEVEDR